MLLKIIGFEVPSSSSWREQREQLVMAMFDATPPPHWIELFHEMVTRRGGAVAKAVPVVEKDRLVFTATRANVSRLCVLFREILLDVDQQFVEWSLTQRGEGSPKTF